MHAARPLYAETRPERGVYREWLNGNPVYSAVTSRGVELPVVGVPVGMETERDVILRVAAALDAADPQPPRGPAQGHLRLVTPPTQLVLHR